MLRILSLALLAAAAAGAASAQDASRFAIGAPAGAAGFGELETDAEDFKTPPVAQVGLTYRF